MIYKPGSYLIQLAKYQNYHIYWQVVILVFILNCFSLFAQAPQKNLDTTKFLNQSHSPVDTVKWRGLSTLAQYYSKKQPNKKRFQYYNNLQLKQAQKINDPIFLLRANCISLIGRFTFSSTGNNVTPEWNEFPGYIQEAKKLKQPLVLYTLITTQANYYSRKLKFDISLQYFTEALQIAEEYNLLVEQSQTLLDLVRLCNMAGLNEKALYYAEKTVAVCEKLGDPQSLIVSYTSLGVIYESLGQKEKAYEYNKKCLPLVDKVAPYLQSVVYLNIGSSAGNLGKYIEAEQCFKNSNKIAIQIKDTAAISNSLILTAANYLSQKRFNDALHYGLQAEEIIKLMNDTQKRIFFERDIDFYLHQIYEAKQMPADALRYLKRHYLLKDSIIKQENANKFIEAQTKFETERVETQNKLLGEQNKAKEAQIENARYLRLILIMSLLGVAGGALFFYYRYRIRTQTNKVLTTQKNQIIQQKAQIENAYEELNATLEQVQTQKEEIQIKNHKIEDSIRYAYQIQSTILPDKDYLDQILPSHFIYYQPKDIVSGDFYWAYKAQSALFICLADCTGHGVPGAFMSVIGSNALFNSIRVMGLIKPDEILYELDNNFTQTLRQNLNSTSKDGMDVCLCVLQGDKCYYAGAGRPLYHLQNGELIEYKPNKFPIGGGQYEQKVFTTHEINLLQGDRLYLFSDGITDQFGGKDKRKFTPKRLQDFIINSQHLSLPQQGSSFKLSMNEWIGSNTQLDDLTFIGFEINSCCATSFNAQAP